VAILKRGERGEKKGGKKKGKKEERGGRREGGSLILLNLNKTSWLIVNNNLL
jgi:hypothetical protein